MKKVFLVALLLGFAAMVGQAQIDIQATEFSVDKAPQTNPNLGSRAVGDYLYYVDVEAVTADIRCLGVENLGPNNDWWVTGAADMLGAYLYTIDYAGTTLLGQYSQGNTGWAWRDLGFDGAYLYASDSYVIEQIDPATGMTTGVTIASPVSPARAMAYDPVTDSFWTASFSSSIYNIDRAGGYTTYANTNALSIYGMAMDDSTDTLWIWSQDGSGSLASAFDPRTGTLTGDSWDGGTAPIFGIAGGACIFDDPTHGTVFAGMHQASPDNVAVYEMAFNPMPQLDIKCNGEDDGVIVYAGANAVIDIDVEARQGAGYNVDLWCVIKRLPSLYYSYNGASWGAGLGNVYYTGPLGDVTDTILNQSVPIGSYIAYVALDTNANGTLDMGSIFDYDEVDFTVEVPPREYKWDDGTTENLLAWVVGGDMVGMHRFDTIPGGENITEIGTIFGSTMFPNYAPGNGTQTDFYIWEDPTPDYNPTDCVLINQGTGVVASVDLDVHEWDAITATITTDHFWVAYNLHHAAGQYCLAIDDHTPYVAGSAYYCGSDVQYAFDPTNLSNNTYLPAESPYGFWTVRAVY